MSFDAVPEAIFLSAPLEASIWLLTVSINNQAFAVIFGTAREYAGYTSMAKNSMQSCQRLFLIGM